MFSSAIRPDCSGRTLTYDPFSKDERREAALANYPQNPVPPFAPSVRGSWDEYPFASTQQGGIGATVMLVPKVEQDAQGGTLNAFYASQLLDVPQRRFLVDIVP